MKLPAPLFILERGDGSLSMEWYGDNERFAIYIDKDPKDSCWTHVGVETRDCGPLNELSSDRVLPILKRLGTQ